MASLLARARLGLLWLLLGSPLHAEPLQVSCGLVERGSIHIDGLLSDWEGVPALELPVRRLAAFPGRPLAARVRCNYDELAVYLLIEVDDDVLVRSRAAGPGEDHLELGFLAGGKVERLLLWPAFYKDKVPRHSRWAAPGRLPPVIEGEGPAGRLRPKGAPAFEVYDALQPEGYAVEVRLPKKVIPGYRENTPLRLGVRVVDTDSKAIPRPVAVAETGPVERPEGLAEVRFQEGESTLASLFAQLRLGPGDVFWEKHGDLGSGPARLLLIGPYLAVVGKEYVYQQVAQRREDIKETQLITPADGGPQALAVRTAENGAGGSREVLRIFQARPGRASLFQTLFAAEVGKQQGAGRLQTQVQFVRRGKNTDILLLPRPAVGFTADTYHEVPAQDVDPILLPWRNRRARYAWKNDAYVRTE